MRVSSLWSELVSGESTRLRARVRWGLLSAYLLSAPGCAPSYRLVHEGDRYFEHCYAAEFDHSIGPNTKEACWQAWLTYYTKHQPAHRVDYALLRIEALQNGEPAPELPGLPQAPHLATQPSEQVHAETPATAGSGAAPELVTTMADAGPVPNGCLPFCNEYESSCNGRCDRGSLACSANCERERSICLKGCY